jgi:hypothetical protein
MKILCMFLILIPCYITNITCHIINPYLAGLQTKGKFACPVCGPRMKYHHSRSLGKEVFDEYRNFLPKNHRYQTTKKHIFNGKEETAIKPRRMTPHLWKLAYNRNHQGKQFDYVSHKMFYNFYLY